MADTPASQLCQKSSTLEHVLSNSPRALGDGRYRWCHDQVLRALVDTITAVIQNSKNQHTPKHSITFVRAATSTTLLGWASCHCKGLAPPSRPGKAAEVPGTHLNHLTRPRHGVNIGVYKASSLIGTYCPLGKPNGKGQQVQDYEICRAGYRLQEQWLESPWQTSRGWMLGIHWPVIVLNSQTPWS